MVTPPRPVLLTGASTGIGYATALRLAKAGFHVYAGVRKAADADRLRNNAPTGNGAIEPVTLDVTRAEDIAALKTTLEAQHPDGLYALINNAGIAVPGPVEFLPPDRLRWQLEVNVVGAVAVTQAFLPLIRKARGRVVMVSSVSGRLSAPLLAAYSASKFALEAISDSLRMEMKQFGVEVVVIEPGQVSTPIWAKSTQGAEADQSDFPPEAFELYGPAMEMARRIARGGEKYGADPDLIAQDIEKALTKKTPKTRYVKGRGARPGIFLAKWVPDRLRDKMLIKRLMGG